MCRVRSTVKTCVVMIIYAESVFLRSLDLISRFDKKIMPKWYAKNVNREELEEFLGLLFLEGLHRSARVNYGNWNVSTYSTLQCPVIDLYFY